MKYLIAILTLSGMFCSCQPNTGKVPAITTQELVQTDTASLRKLMEKSARKEVDIAEVLFNYDTLKIALFVDHLYYPFGKHADIDEITKQITNKKIDTIYLTDSIAGDSSKAIKVSTPKSWMKFYFEKDEKRQQIVSARILDTNFHFKNKIQLGMKKQDFMSVFFLKPITPPSNIIKLISSIEGINHYYYFKNNELTEIKITTNYVFDNKY